MGNVIELNAPSSMVPEPPLALFRLRWRIEVTSGLEIHGPWTPQTKHPSLSMTLREFQDRIERVFIDGYCERSNVITTFLCCPGYAFLSMTYKGMLNARTGKSATIGIELADRENCVYLILRDGTVYQEKVKDVPNNNN